ncbi:hypothetical protein [Chloroflexus sp.]|uniref:hypothetical protein n=1 Tax=Chloroflexus sp. TaxID=1904827 RepID=UPI002ACDF962|nr:hypothetical protein [Chloroflexus sp.]
MATTPPTNPELTDTGARESYEHLEQAYILEYLRSQGLTLEQVRAMPAEQAKEIMRAASLYASTQMATVEARAHLVEELHGGPRAL